LLLTDDKYFFATLYFILHRIIIIIIERKDLAIAPSLSRSAPDLGDVNHLASFRNSGHVRRGWGQSPQKGTTENAGVENATRTKLAG